MNHPALRSALRILLLLILVSQVVSAQTNGTKQLILKGDAAYSRGAYDSALLYYQQATSGKTPDAVALFKLGNAHYRLKHIGEAVLSYERALSRQPGFAAAAQNVRVIQQQVAPQSTKEIFFIRWWRVITAPALSNVWASVAIALFAGLLGLLAWSRYKGARPRWQRPQVIAATLIAAVAMLIFSFAGAIRDVPRAHAVVMRPDAKFRPAASTKGTAIALPEGLLIRVLNNRKDEVIIALPDGQQGFVQRSDIAVVE